MVSREGDIESINQHVQANPHGGTGRAHTLPEQKKSLMLQGYFLISPPWPFPQSSFPLYNERDSGQGLWRPGSSSSFDNLKPYL